MADLILYTNPQSRGRIIRWMLEEVGQAYETEIIPYDELKSERFWKVNPMGKVPAIQHGGTSLPKPPRSALTRRRLSRGRPWPARGGESGLLSLAVLCGRSS